MLNVVIFLTFFLLFITDQPPWSTRSLDISKLNIILFSSFLFPYDQAPWSNPLIIFCIASFLLFFLFFFSQPSAFVDAHD